MFTTRFQACMRWIGNGCIRYHIFLQEFMYSCTRVCLSRFAPCSLFTAPVYGPPDHTATWKTIRHHNFFMSLDRNLMCWLCWHIPPPIYPGKTIRPTILCQKHAKVSRPETGAETTSRLSPKMLYSDRAKAKFSGLKSK